MMLDFILMKFRMMPTGVWWADTLIYVLLPLAAAFLVLQRSNWHRELSGIRRVVWLLLVSVLVFGAVLLLAGIVALSSVVFFYRFNAFHC